MAQRTIHYLLGELLLREQPLPDPERFLLGSLLPDAYDDPDGRALTHFKNTSVPGMRYFDFDAFRERFADRMEDGLYRGYYLHLVEDNFYRLFFRRRLSLAIDPHNAAQVARLHRDYTLLNACIVERFGLRNRVALPADFDAEPLCALAHFAPEAFLAEFETDFHVSETGELCYLTAEVLDEFVAQTLPLCLRELQSLCRGEHFLKARDLAWTRP